MLAKITQRIMMKILCQQTIFQERANKDDKHKRQSMVDLKPAPLSQYREDLHQMKI